MNRFSQCLDFILSPKYGHALTQHAVDVWAERHHLDRVFLKNLTTPQISDVYFSLYWLFGKCPYLPAPLDLAVFHLCINHDPRQAAGILQAALNIRDDGVIGRSTLAAAMDCNQRRVARLIVEQSRRLLPSASLDRLVALTDEVSK